MPLIRGEFIIEQMPFSNVLARRINEDHIIDLEHLSRQLVLLLLTVPHKTKSSEEIEGAIHKRTLLLWTLLRQIMW